MRHKRPRLVRILRLHYRRFLARLDRVAPDWQRWVPSWGTSLLIHALGLLLLAIFFYVRSGRDERFVEHDGTFAGQLRDDVTSLVDSDHAGDPFTTIQTPDSPSLPLEPPDPNTTLISQPEIPSLVRFAPELASPAPGAGRSESGIRPMRTTLHSEDLTAPFSGRQGPTRAQLVRREGGTVHSEKAVDAGLDWLARHQQPDGSWSLNYQGQCQGAGCRQDRALETSTAATGLALLPLLGAGHIHTVKSRYQEHVRKGLTWLVANQKSTGELFTDGGRNTYLYSHAIAAMALCEAFGISSDSELREPAQRAINFIVAAQNTENGGWRYYPGQSGDTSVFGWQMFALRSGRLGGLTVPPNVIKGCRVYLDLANDDGRKVTYSYLPGGPATPVMTAEALLSRQYLGWPRNFPPLVKGASQVAAHLRESDDRNIYYWYYATQLLHNMQNKDWKRWNVQVRDALVAMQVTGQGCDRGSWDPFQPQPDRWGRAGGRLFVTALSILTLEVYYRFLPLYQPSDDDAIRLDNQPPARDKNAERQPKAPALKKVKAKP
jgi:hypothetical protein